MEQYPLLDQDYMVLIRCYTYNHEAYIEDALKGFVMQKTNFPFVAVVVDDASTDGTANIIRKYEIQYPEIIKGVYLTDNHYSQKKPKMKYIAPWRERCKYEAICEGDDYWIDPFKLQKQVDFLEQNPNYGLTYTKSEVYNQELKKYENKTIGEKAESFEELIKFNYIPTLTTCFKIDLYDKYKKEILKNKKFKMGDYPLWLFISLNSKIKFIEESTSVYRILNQSASHHKNIQDKIDFINSSSEICAYFLTYANRWDLKSIYKEKYCNLIIGNYISYNLPVKYSSIRKYWLWRPKFIVKYLLSQISLTRNLLK